MPGRYLTQYEMLQLITQAAQPAIQKYGIKNSEDFIWALMAVAYAESPGPTAQDGSPTWDTQSVHDNGQGFGLFAEHNQGYAGYLTKEERLDPITNAQAAAMKLGQVWNDNASFEQNVQRMTGPEGQNPANPAALKNNAMALFRRVERKAMRTYEAGEVPLTGGYGASQGIGTWLSGKGLVPQGTDADTWLMAQPSAVQTWLTELYLKDIGLVTEEEQAGLTPEEQRLQALEVREREAGIGLLPYELDVESYERQRQYYEDLVARGQTTIDQAVQRFNAWLSGSAEAGRRAEKVMDIREERARRTLPTEYFPQTEPGGMLATVAGRYNLPYTPLRGVPTSQLPMPEAAYGEFQRRMGLSETAPTIPSPEAIPVAQPPQTSQARSYIQDLLNRAGLRQPQLRMGGV